jgi:hypothetical protein
MNCWHCNKELIWGGDHDVEDNEEYTIVTNLSCPECDSYVEVYLPKDKENNNATIN